MKFVLLIWLTAVIKYTEANKWKYCQPESCFGSRHTLCEYEESEMGSACNQVLSNTITNEEKKEIVKTHNMLRNKVANGREKRGNPGPQPRGDIKNLRWDRRLAIIAQRWANQCTIEHDPCRDVRRFQVGQNVGYTGKSTKHFDKLSVLITNWYDEVADFPNYLVESYRSVSGAVIGHYTNIVWGNTTRVGCGLVRHYTHKRMYRSHLVCNYGARGNWIGDPVYQTKNIYTDRRIN